MSYGRPQVSYKTTNVQTASQLDLVIMCYENAVRMLEETKIAYREGRYQDKAKKLEGALAIIDELKCALDFDRGGQIARNLDAIYAYFTRTLLKADVEKDFDAFDRVIEMMNSLKETWEELNATPQKVQAEELRNLPPRQSTQVTAAA